MSIIVTTTMIATNTTTNTTIVFIYVSYSLIFQVICIAEKIADDFEQFFTDVSSIIKCYRATLLSRRLSFLNCLLQDSFESYVLDFNLKGRKCFQRRSKFLIATVVDQRQFIQCS